MQNEIQIEATLLRLSLNIPKQKQKKKIFASQNFILHKKKKVDTIWHKTNNSRNMLFVKKKIGDWGSGAYMLCELNYVEDDLEK
jgi:hypothetical protein